MPSPLPVDVLDLRLQIEELEEKLDRPVVVDSPNARESRDRWRRILDELYAKVREAEA